MAYFLPQFFFVLRRNARKFLGSWLTDTWHLRPVQSASFVSGASSADVSLSHAHKRSAAERKPLAQFQDDEQGQTNDELCRRINENTRFNNRLWQRGINETSSERTEQRIPLTCDDVLNKRTIILVERIGSLVQGQGSRIVPASRRWSCFMLNILEIILENLSCLHPSWQSRGTKVLCWVFSQFDRAESWLRSSQ